MPQEGQHERMRDSEFRAAVEAATAELAGEVAEWKASHP